MNSNARIYRNDCSNKSLSLAGYTVRYNSYVAAIQTYEEIFEQLHYDVVFASERPFIIDCGSNIGLATLFFKSKCPNAKILCFEPDKRAFSVLEQNIAGNNLINVEAINAAVSGIEGQIKFYGQVERNSLDVRGNSILYDWGMQRTSSSETLVESVLLSQYINKTVDFLKLDIEGAEQQVLSELGSKLELIKELHIEIHETEAIRNYNNVSDIRAILEEHGFVICRLQESNIDILPAETKMWVANAHPKLYSLRAIRK